MASVVKCRLCGEKIKYSPEEIWQLGNHLLRKHPGEEITHLSFDDDEGDGIRYFESKRGSGDNKGSSKSISDFGTRKSKMYKTTVETWRQGPSCFRCPQCGIVGQPLIRKRQNKIAKSSLGALCLLGCWPLCFFPFILGGSNIMNLYCKNCGHFLGTYDRRNGRFKCPEKNGSDTKIPNMCEE